LLSKSGASIVTNEQLLATLAPGASAGVTDGDKKPANL